jgi:hypothetical protein
LIGCGSCNKPYTLLVGMASNAISVMNLIEESYGDSINY